ncbi:GGDEF domain-containing protein [Variovorax ginsengisoli]|uniref:diguanylate cyclase n=1 Tax=Variovorax ginsengisoli TaxID=363844 RepID=A0ABT9SCW9_9BURK|nr:GGDEF domain-containing protein [Variovorax ginsengisoli]MDP9902203.1 diguanylate cyclase (GGDEF)-like protein [Variovorax ginsengisoli]
MSETASVLDPRSIILVAGVMGLMMAFVIFFLRRSYPASVGGLREWTLGPVLSFGSTLLFAARGFVPDFVSIVVANMVLFQACIYHYVGSQRFLGDSGSTRQWTVLNLLLGVGLFWFMAVHPNYPARLILFTGAVTLMFVMHTRLYMRHSSDDLGMRLMTGVLVAQAVVAGLRGISAVAGLAGHGIMDNAWLQSGYLVMYSLTALFLTIGAVVLASDRMRAEFEFMATHDTLTGALTRRAILNLCEQELDRCQRTGSDMALLMIDIDHFKLVNDTYGHLVGDAVLRLAVARMQRVLGEGGHLGRYGGEEFLALLPGSGGARAEHTAEQLRNALLQPFDADTYLASTWATSPKPPTPPTASFGIASHRGEGETLDHMLLRADTAVYRSKALGRNRVEHAG